MGCRGLGNSAVSWEDFALYGNSVWRLGVGFYLLPTEFSLASLEHGYFLAALGVFRSGCDDSVDVDLLVVCFHQPGNVASDLCYLSNHHDCT